MIPVHPTPAQACAEDFERLERGLPGAGLPWLARLRREAVSGFAELGFPAGSEEVWRLTPISRLTETRFERAAAGGSEAMRRLPALSLRPGSPLRLTFLNGRWLQEWSGCPGLPAGVTAGPLSRLLEEEPRAVEAYLGPAPGLDSFGLLNAALFEDGALIAVPRGVSVEEPIHLLFASAPGARPAATHPVVVIAAAEGARVSVIEEHLGEPGTYWTNSNTRLAAGPGASIDYTRIVREGDGGLHLAGVRARLGRDARLASHTVVLGGALTRHAMDVLLEDEGAEATLNGLTLLSGREHGEHRTLVDHIRPHGSSRVLYKSVLDGPSRAVFNGTVVVRPNAQKTAAHVYNRNLLLSEEGLAHTKPEFKIYANDLVAKHGATVGQISPEALFYLRTRGLSPEAARRLLVEAFAQEMIERVPVADLREALAGEIRARFLAGARHA